MYDIKDADSSLCYRGVAGVEGLSSLMWVKAGDYDLGRGSV